MGDLVKILITTAKAAYTYNAATLIAVCGETTAPHTHF